MCVAPWITIVCTTAEGTIWPHGFRSGAAICPDMAKNHIRFDARPKIRCNPLHLNTFRSAYVRALPGFGCGERGAQDAIGGRWKNARMGGNMPARSYAQAELMS